MNKYQVNFAASFVLGFVGTAVLLKALRRRHQREVAKITADTHLQIAAISRAAEIVKQKIDAGEYDSRGLAGVNEDFNFYIMTERFND